MQTEEKRTRRIQTLLRHFNNHQQKDVHNLCMVATVADQDFDESGKQSTRANIIPIALISQLNALTT